MKRCLSILICAVVFAGTYVSTGYATTYTGELKSVYFNLWPSGVYTSGNWELNPVKFSWKITDDAAGALKTWKYTYSFDYSVCMSDVDSIIIEASDGASVTDFVGLTGAKFDGPVQDQTNSSNPGLPDTIYGIKLTPTYSGLSYDKWTFSFYSDRAPVWGDFYARDNTCLDCFGCSTYAYNYGFTANDVDPTSPASNCSLACHILRPNDVPEPATIAMMIISGLMIVRKYRK